MVICCGEKPWEPGSLLTKEQFSNIEIPLPSSEDRFRIWNGFLNGYIIPNRDELLSQISTTFRINGKQINNAVSTAIRKAYIRDPEGVMLTNTDIVSACQYHSSPFLCKHARKVTCHYQWDDIVLPDDKIEQLRGLCAILLNLEESL